MEETVASNPTELAVEKPMSQKEEDAVAHGLGDDYGYEDHSPTTGHGGIPRRNNPRVSKRSSLTEFTGAANRRKSRMSVEVPFDISYHPGAITFFAPPRQRQRWGDTQILPRVNWGDLFFDLFYVAAAYNTSNILVDSPSSQGVLYFVGTILPVMAIWYDKTYYDGRFVVGDDLYHRLAEIAGLLALASAVVHIRPVDILSHPSEHVDMFGFCVSMVVAELLSMFRRFELYFTGIGERSTLKRLAVMEVLMLLVGLLFYLVGAVISGLEYFGKDNDGATDRHRVLASTEEYPAYETSTTNIPILLCLLSPTIRFAINSVRVIFLFPNDGSHKKFIVPMNVDFFIHRSGEWVMLMLGEPILSLLIVDVPTESDEYFWTFYCSLATVILLEYLHFRSQPHHADDHAARRDKNAGMMLGWFHQVYSASLIALGAAFTLFVMEFSYEDYGDGRLLAGGGAPKYDFEERQRRMGHVFSASLALVFFSLDAMSICHVGLKGGKNRCVCKHTKTKNTKGMILVALRAGIIAFVATLSQWVTSPQRLAGTGLALTVLQIVLRYVGTILFPYAQVYALDGKEEPVANQGAET